jgi:hypothetical protein
LILWAAWHVACKLRFTALDLSGRDALVDADDLAGVDVAVIPPARPKDRAGGKSATAPLTPPARRTVGRERKVAIRESYFWLQF